MALFFSFVPQTNANVAPCDTYQVNGGDQAFLMNLNTPLEWGGTVYTNNIYISPKGTVTFGQGDYTFWSYPATPSISIGSWDYHAFANDGSAQWDPGWGVGKDLYVRYGSTATSICVDWKVMVWGQTSGEPIYIRMLAEVNPINYTWTPTYQVSSNAPGGARYGARYTTNGPIQPLSVQTITTPPSPSPTPSPTITPTPTPTPTPAGCPQIYLYPFNSNPCDHFGSFTLYEVDDIFSPSRLWLVNECGITPVTGGNQWFSQGPGATSYQVDNGGFIINTASC